MTGITIAGYQKPSKLTFMIRIFKRKKKPLRELRGKVCCNIKCKYYGSGKFVRPLTNYADGQRVGRGQYICVKCARSFIYPKEEVEEAIAYQRGSKNRSGYNVR